MAHMTRMVRGSSEHSRSSKSETGNETEIRVSQTNSHIGTVVGGRRNPFERVMKLISSNGLPNTGEHGTCLFRERLCARPRPRPRPRLRGGKKPALASPTNTDVDTLHSVRHNPRATKRRSLGKEQPLSLSAALSFFRCAGL